MNTNLPKFNITFPIKEQGIFKHFLPLTLLVTNRHDRDLAISLLGFNTRQAYVEAENGLSVDELESMWNMSSLPEQ